MDQTQRHRYVSRFEHPALHSRLHHREGFLIHYRSTKLLSQPYNATEAIQPQSTSTEEGYGPQSTNQLHLTLEGANTNLNLYRRGSKPIPLRSTSTKEGYNKTRRVYNLEVSTTSNNLFSTKQDPNRIGQKISSSVENKCFDQRKSLGKISN